VAGVFGRSQQELRWDECFADGSFAPAKTHDELQSLALEPPVEAVQEAVPFMPSRSPGVRWGAAARNLGRAAAAGAARRLTAYLDKE